MPSSPYNTPVDIDRILSARLKLRRLSNIINISLHLLRLFVGTCLFVDRILAEYFQSSVWKCGVVGFQTKNRPKIYMVLDEKKTCVPVISDHNFNQHNEHVITTESDNSILIFYLFDIILIGL